MTLSFASPLDAASGVACEVRVYADASGGVTDVFSVDLNTVDLQGSMDTITMQTVSAVILNHGSVFGLRKLQLLADFDIAISEPASVCLVASIDSLD